MKSDINLLQKKKGKQYSAQKIALMLVFLVFFAGAVYAGFTLPQNALTAAQLKAAGLNRELTGSSGAGDSLSELTQNYLTRSEQLEALTAIDGARSDINGYLEAVEKSLPTSANLSTLTLSGKEMSITGVALSDADVAAFCLRLRETGAFANVFLQNSIALEDYGVTFSLLAELPATLDSSGILPEETEAAESAATAEETAS